MDEEERGSGDGDDDDVDSCFLLPATAAYSLNLLVTLSGVQVTLLVQWSTRLAFTRPSGCTDEARRADVSGEGEKTHEIKRVKALLERTREEREEGGKERKGEERRGEERRIGHSLPAK